MFPHERIERQDATLAFVIGAQCQYNIFQCCLNSERPDDARHCTNNVVGGNNRSGTDDCSHDIER